jgi:hypothetical protein
MPLYMPVFARFSFCGGDEEFLLRKFAGFAVTSCDQFPLSPPSFQTSSRTSISINNCTSKEFQEVHPHGVLESGLRELTFVTERERWMRWRVLIM